MGHLVSDLRLALRGWARTPGFTVVAITSIALGMGATTAVFTLVDQVLLRTLPVQAPERARAGEHRRVALRQQLGRRQRAVSSRVHRSCATTPAFCRRVRAIRLRHAARRTAGARSRRRRAGDGKLLPGAWRHTGRPAVSSRQTTTGSPAAHPVAVLSHGYWQSRFGGDPAVVGSKAIINGHPFTIVGVAQPGFEGLELGRKSDVFVPMMMKKLMTPGWDASTSGSIAGSACSRGSRPARRSTQARHGDAALRARGS